VGVSHAAESVMGSTGSTGDEDVSVDGSNGPLRWQDPNELVRARLLGLVGRASAQHR